MFQCVFATTANFTIKGAVSWEISQILAKIYSTSALRFQV